MIKKKLSKLFTIFVILSITCNLFSPIVGAVNIEVSGSGSDNKVQYYPCSTADDPNYPSYGCGTFVSNFAVRISLVEKDSTKPGGFKLVNGAKTIEFRHNGGEDKWSGRNTNAVIDIHGGISSDVKGFYCNKNKNGVITSCGTSLDINYISDRLSKNKSFYSLSDGLNVITGSSYLPEVKVGGKTNTADAQPIYEINLFGGGGTPGSITDFKTMGDAFRKYLVSNEKNSPFSGSYYSILGAYLNICYGSDDSSAYVNNDNYYLLIEPVWRITFKLYKQKNAKIIEGTGKQLAQFIKYNYDHYHDTYKNTKETHSTWYFGYWAGLRTSVFYNYACGMHVGDKIDGINKTAVGNACKNETNFKGTFSKSISNTYRDNLILNAPLTNSDLLGTIASSDNLYGVNLVKLTDVVEVIRNVSCEFTLNRCDTKTNSISFRLVAKNENGNEDDGAYGACVKNISQITGSSCYDKINYDVGSVLMADNLNGVMKNYTFQNVPSIFAKVSRECWLDGTEKAGFTGNLPVLNILGSSYKFTNSDAIDSNSSPNLNVGGARLRTSTNTYRYYLNGDGVYGSNGILNVDINSTKPVNSYDPLSALTMGSTDTYSRYIYISSAMNDTSKEKNNVEFSSNLSTLLGQTDGNIISNLDGASKNYFYSDGSALFSLTYKYVDNGGSSKCYFQPGDNKDDVDLKFRVISLSYPFPAKDGKSRLPGLNWFDDENYVYKYITNNRNIQSTKTSSTVVNPENIYLDKEPLYTINLDAQSISKIRNYNKTKSYDDINLECSDGRQCYSTFLRDNGLISSGTCKDTKSDFYGCADKTYESGG